MTGYLFRSPCSLRIAWEHPDIAYDLNNLALLYCQQAKYEQAEPLLQRALTISEQQLGPQHLAIATSLYLLAFLYEQQGKYVEAEAGYQRTLAIYERILGPDHPDTISTREQYTHLQRTMRRRSRRPGSRPKS